MVMDLCVFVSLVLVGLVVEGEIIVNWVYYFDWGFE